jgi:hypothetical protein
VLGAVVSADVRVRSASVVRFCGGVRSCGGCSFGGGDVFVHRCRGFDPSVGVRRGRDAGRAAAHDEVMTPAINTSDVDSADGEEPKPIAATGTLRVESRTTVVLQASAE